MAVGTREIFQLFGFRLYNRLYAVIKQRHLNIELPGQGRA